MTVDQPSVNAADLALGAIAAASPWWLNYLREGSEVYVLLAGVVLVSLRVAAAWRDWRGRK